MVEKGTFRNGVPYIRFGKGVKSLLIFCGGPGNYLSSSMSKEFNFLGKHYTIFMVSRKSGLPKVYSTMDMAEDFAAVIRNDFNGEPVDVIGESYGGLIAQHLAANHPTLIRRLVLSMSAYRFSEEGAKLDMQFAQLASQGKTRAAFRSLTPMLTGNRVKRHLLSFFMSIFGSRILNTQNPQDLLVEGKAEVMHNSRNQLSHILIPTLIVAGDRDYFCPAELLRETASGIPNAKLVIYEGKGHEPLGKRFQQDTLAFLVG
ncbi:MAG: alpha/beta hydrolase [Candidatus Bathyarchaeota archaeon]|nr:alpha/beta hydrolase [Candidatus Bathyarchaeota archaeon]